MLKTKIPKLYKVKAGQTLSSVAEAFSTTPFLLVEMNELKEELFEGQILAIPAVRGNLYTVTPSDTKALLAGSRENYEKKNGRAFYPCMRVLL